MPLTAADRFAALPPEEQARILDNNNAAATAAMGVPQPEPDPEPAANPWAELEDFYDDTLLLRAPGGVEYVIHAVDIPTGIMCQRLVNLGLGALTDYNLSGRMLAAQEGTEATLDDSTEELLYRRLLGGDRDYLGDHYRADHDVWQQLHDNHAPWPLLRHLGVTALFWAGRDRQAALDYWLDGARPKAPAPAPPTTPKQPQDRRASGKAGTASSTRRRASTSSTTPPT